MGRTNQSEMAQLLVQIDEQNRAARCGLSDFAIRAPHEVITARMEQGADLTLQLFKQGREADAIALWNKFVDHDKYLIALAGVEQPEERQVQ